MLPKKITLLALGLISNLTAHAGFNDAINITPIVPFPNKALIGGQAIKACYAVKNNFLSVGATVTLATDNLPTGMTEDNETNNACQMTKKTPACHTGLLFNGAPCYIALTYKTADPSQKGKILSGIVKVKAKSSDGGIVINNTFPIKDPEMPYQISLTGTGSMQVTHSLAFSPRPQQPVTLTMTITNTDAKLTLKDMQQTINADTALATITPLTNQCQSTLAPKQFCQITYQVTPLTNASFDAHFTAYAYGQTYSTNDDIPVTVTQNDPPAISYNIAPEPQKNYLSKIDLTLSNVNTIGSIIIDSSQLKVPSGVADIEPSSSTKKDCRSIGQLDAGQSCQLTWQLTPYVNQQFNTQFFLCTGNGFGCEEKNIPIRFLHHEYLTKNINFHPAVTALTANAQQMFLGTGYDDNSDDNNGKLYVTDDNKHWENIPLVDKDGVSLKPAIIQNLSVANNTVYVGGITNQTSSDAGLLIIPNNGWGDVSAVEQFRGNNILSLTRADKQGNLYATVDLSNAPAASGILWQGQGSHWVKMTDAGMPDNAAINKVLLDDNGDGLYALSRGMGIYHYVNNEWLLHSNDISMGADDYDINHLNSLVVADNKIYAASHKKIFSSSSIDGTQPWEGVPSIEATSLGGMVNTIQVNSNECVFAGTDSIASNRAQLWHYCPSDKVWQATAFGKPVSTELDGTVWQLYSQGRNVYAGTQQGVYRFDADAPSQYDALDREITNKPVTSIVGLNATYYSSTLGDGVFYKTNGSEWGTVAPKSPVHNVYRLITTSDGKLYSIADDLTKSNQQALFLLANNKWQAENVLLSSHLLSATSIEGTLYLGLATTDHIVTYQAGKMSSIPLSVTAHINAMTHDSNDRLCIALQVTGDNLPHVQCWDTTDEKWTPLANKLPDDITPTALNVWGQDRQANDIFYLGTEHHGMYRWQDGQWQAMISNGLPAGVGIEKIVTQTAAGQTATNLYAIIKPVDGGIAQVYMYRKDDGWHVIDKQYDATSLFLGAGGSKLYLGTKQHNIYTYETVNSQ